MNGSSNRNLIDSGVLNKRQVEEIRNGGERREVRVEQRTNDNTVTTNAASTTSGTKVAVLISSPKQIGSLFDTGGPLPSDAAATIWAGALDDSGIVPVGLDNKTLDIAVTRPDGNTENFSVTTDSEGTSSIDYDFSQSGRGDGTYSISVTDQDGVSTTTEVNVGVNVISTTWTFQDIFVGEETTFAFLAHNGDEGQSGVDLTLRLVNQSDDSIVKSTSKSTDSDGFATLSATAPAPGNYQVEAVRNGNVVATEYLEAVEIKAVTDYSLSLALVGATNAYGGYLDSGNGPVTNTDFTLEAYTDREQNDLYASQTLTTDENGFFFFKYDLSDSYNSGDLYLSAQTADGQDIKLSEDDIDVDDGSSGGSDPAVEFTASTSDYNYFPGETITVDIEATDSDNAITDQTVEVFLRYDSSGPPLYSTNSTTVTTGSDGTVSVSTTIPNNAPDGSEIDGTIAMQYDGSTYTASINADIQQYEIDLDTFDVAPGTSNTITFNVTDRETGDAVSGIPIQFDAQYDDDRAGSFATGKIISDSTGSVSTSIDVPDDVGFSTLLNDVHRNRGDNIASLLKPNYPGTLSTNDTLIAGQQADFTFDVPSGVSVTGILFARTDDPKEKGFGTYFQSAGTISVDIPSEFESGDYANFQVWAFDSNGDRYRDRNFLQISGSLAVDASGEQGISSGGEGTASISAQQVSQITVKKLWTDWSLSDQNPDGGSVTDSISSSGEVVVDYSSVQADASPSLTVSVPNRYIGGTYVFDVTASDDDGNTVDTTATFTIS